MLLTGFQQKHVDTRVIQLGIDFEVFNGGGGGPAPG